MENNLILKVENMNISYKSPNKQPKVIVKDGNFEVHSGELVLIIGENGTGKSSIFRSIVGDDSLDRPFLYKLKSLFSKRKKVTSVNEKKMWFKGKLIETHEDLDFFRRSIGYAKQDDDSDLLYQRKIWDYVLDYASHSNAYYSKTTKELEEEISEVYDKLDCNTYADGEYKKIKLKYCSGGEKRMSSILAALSRKASDLFILDEPINNLDAYHARKLNNYLIDLKNKQNAPGILIITHCHMFQNVDTVYKLKNGKLIKLKKDEYKPKSCFGISSSDGKYIEGDNL